MRGRTLPVFVGGVRLFQARRQEDPQDVPDAGRGAGMASGRRGGAARRMRAPTSLTVAQAAEAWLQGARAGMIRNRSGDQYKPSAIRAYEQALRLRVRPQLGAMRLSDVTRNDLQDLVDWLVAGAERDHGRRDALPAPGDLQARDGPRRDRDQPDDRAWRCPRCGAAETGSPRRRSARSCSRRSRRATGRCGRPRCTPVCVAAS